MPPTAQPTVETPAETSPPDPSVREDLCQCCGAELGGRYCARCGQDGSLRRLELRRVLGEALDQLLSLDATLPRTLRELTVDPGGVARRYVAGRRRIYVNPLKYCLAITALYFVWNRWLGIDVVDMSALDGLDARKAEVFGRAIGWVLPNLGNVLFLALPIYALVLRFIFRGAGFNFAENYAFVLFVTGQAFVLNMGVALVALLVPEARLVLRVVVHGGFFVFAALGFYGQRSPLGVVKALLAHGLYMLIVGLLVSSAIVAGVVYQLSAG